MGGSRMTREEAAKVLVRLVTAVGLSARAIK